MFNTMIDEMRPVRIRVEDFLDVAAVMILFITADEEVALVNRRGHEMLGYPEEEIIGKNWFDSFLPRRVRSAVRAAFHGLMEGRGEAHEYTENVVLTADGEERLIRWHNAVVRDERDRVIGTLSSGLDITELRANEAALRESEARSRAVLETTVDAIITADAAGRIQTMNTAAERMFGYGRGEVVGRSLNILMPSPHRDVHDAHMRAYKETGEAKIIGVGREVSGRRKDGTTFPLELAVSEFKVGDRHFFTGVIRDISDRRALEREVLRIAEEERERIGRDLHDSLGSLLAGGAMVVQGLVSKAQRGETIGAADLERVADLLDRGAQQAHTLARGLNPMRLEGGGLRSALAELATSSAEMSGIACTFSASPDLPPVEKGVAMQIFRIAQEAVTNAIKHAKARRIAVELHRSDDHLKLIVRDDGVGLPPDEDRSGLGMHIMSYRARTIDAHFSIESTEGGGTLVSCVVPCQADEPQ